MTRQIGLAVPDGGALAAEFHDLGLAVRRMDVDELSTAALDSLAVLVIPATATVLTATLVAACDRAAVRVVPLAEGQRGAALATSFGLTAVSEITAQAILSALRAAPAAPGPRPPARVIAVWGPPGAPGRTTVAVSLAAELARGGRSSALVDADTHAPAVAQLLGLSDDGPGFAAACRQAGRGLLDRTEYARIVAHVAAAGTALEVLVGLNRPARWPELRGDRVRGALQAMRGWTDHVVVDVAAPLEADEAIVTDLDDGPCRNAASRAVLTAADTVVAVVGADAVALARAVRSLAELRELAPAADVRVVVDRFRSRAIGVDARGQIRRTLERFADVPAPLFLPDDPVLHDRAMLHAIPAVALAPRSAYAAGIRRLAAAVAPVDAPAPARVERGSRRRARGREAVLATP
ncbi:AAA family ATPase [Microbacterium gorillae]|uniref:AAA family ATPase n=1 Tax=Microbacterium gorillae TaxID=1231063 RepID=UPI0006947F12|nr:P-loop NTPase [Microbacterium gorillae]